MPFWNPPLGWARRLPSDRMVWRPRCRPRTEARGRRRDGHSGDLTPDGPLRKHYSGTFSSAERWTGAAGEGGAMRESETLRGWEGALERWLAPFESMRNRGALAGGRR